MHTYTDKNGTVHTLPTIDEQTRRRLKAWFVVDLLAVINNPAKWTELFERLASDGEMICNMAYALEHDRRDEAAELAFGNLLVGGDAGSGPLLECSAALQQAVIDFFPASHRESIRQFYQMTKAAAATATLVQISENLKSRGCPSTGFGSKIQRNGSSP